jgi:hypothetical protein
VEAAQHAPNRTAVIVLDELDVRAGGFGEGPLIVALGEEAALVATESRSQHEQVGERGLLDQHVPGLISKAG